jgi:hypothetical protein
MTARTVVDQLATCDAQYEHQPSPELDLGVLTRLLKPHPVDKEAGRTAHGTVALPVRVMAYDEVSDGVVHRGLPEDVMANSPTWRSPGPGSGWARGSQVGR